MPQGFILPHNTFLFNPLRFFVQHYFDLHAGVTQKSVANYMNFNFTVNVNGRTMKLDATDGIMVYINLEHLFDS